MTKRTPEHWAEWRKAQGLPHWNKKQRTRMAELLSSGAVVAYWNSDRHGYACNGGRTDFRARAGLIQEIPGPLQLCGAGALHATREPHRWKGERVWVVAMHGEVQWNGDKCGSLHREFIGEILPHEAFIDSVGVRIGRKDLRSADLRSANLRSANLYGANLYGADLYGADLYGADLYGANLYGADLGGADLYGADLRSADLRSANLYGADLRSADLRSANLYGADLGGADLRSADLYGANLRSADLGGADLRSADLGSANLRGADLGGDRKQLLADLGWELDEWFFARRRKK